MIPDPHVHFFMLVLAGASLACTVASCGGGDGPMPAAPQASAVQAASGAALFPAAATLMQMGHAA